MSTTIIGFPRLGEFRELKFTTEKYFRKEISADELLAAAKELRAKHWNIVKEKGISEITSNDFSHYDNVLDAAFLFNVVPSSVQGLELTDLERYFALARGYQGEKGDVLHRRNDSGGNRFAIEQSFQHTPLDEMLLDKLGDIGGFDHHVDDALRIDDHDRPHRTETVAAGFHDPDFIDQPPPLQLGDQFFFHREASRCMTSCSSAEQQMRAKNFHVDFILLHMLIV